ncbi:MAG: hypothetical protein WD960_09180 [Gemmatimonadota bacterium]
MLLDEDRLERLIEYESLAESPTEVYTLADIMEDLRAGVWNELQGSGTIDIDVYRRNLQRGFVDIVDQRLHPSREPSGGQDPGGGQGGEAGPVLTDVRPVLRGELRWIRDALDDAIPRAANPMTRLHLEDLREEVQRILDAEPRR